MCFALSLNLNDNDIHSNDYNSDQADDLRNKTDYQDTPSI